MLSNEGIIADAGAYGDFLLARPVWCRAAIGTTGYCLGGRMSLVAAAGLGRTIAAAASFHGGRLALADDPSSPYLAADRIAATVYMAGAEDDGSFTAEQAELLRGRARRRRGRFHAGVLSGASRIRRARQPDLRRCRRPRHWEALGGLYRARL